MNWKYPEWKKNAIGKTKKTISKILFMVNGSNMCEILVPKGAERGELNKEWRIWRNICHKLKKKKTLNDSSHLFRRSYEP